MNYPKHFLSQIFLYKELNHSITDPDNLFSIPFLSFPLYFVIFYLLFQFFTDVNDGQFIKIFPIRFNVIHNYFRQI
jgi:Fe2+ transport system protein B